MAKLIEYTPEADAALKEIYKYGVREYGLAHAQAYAQGIDRQLDLLAMFPRMGGDCSSIAGNLRRFFPIRPI